MNFLNNPQAAAGNLWLIILLPLFGAIVNGFFGRRIGRGNVAFIACAVVGGAFLVALIPFYWLIQDQVLQTVGGTWFEITNASGRPTLSIGWGLLFDRLSGTLV